MDSKFFLFSARFQGAFAVVLGQVISLAFPDLGVEAVGQVAGNIASGLGTLWFLYGQLRQGKAKRLHVRRKATR